MSPTWGTEQLRSTRRLARGRSALVLLVVAAALFAPIRPTTAQTRVDADAAHQLVRTGAQEPSQHHLAVAHALRNATGAHWRTATPLGTAPTAVLLAGALLTLLAVARRGACTARRRRRSFSRRGPPLSLATG